MIDADTYEAVRRKLADAEAALAEARLREDRFRRLFDAIDEGLAVVEMIYDDHGDIVDMVYRQTNRAYERQGGVYDVVGRSIFDVIPGVEEHWLRPYKEVARTGVAQRIENHQQDVDRWFDVFFSRVDAEGRFVAIVFQDISERKRAEFSLRKSEERQAFLLKLGDAMRAQSDAQAIIEIAAGLLGERLRASRVMFAEFDEAKGIADIFHGWFADGAKPFPSVMRLEDYEGPILDDMRAGLTVRVDNAGTPPFDRPDLVAIADLGVRALLTVPLLVGGRLLVNLSVHQHEPRTWTDDEVSLVQAVAERLWADLVRSRAAAAMRESEARHRHLTGTWAQATWETDASGVVVADSPSWRAYTGQTLDEWLGYGWLDAIHPDDRAHAERQWREAMAVRGLVDAEFRLRAPGDGWRWTNVRAAPVFDAAGGIAKWSGMNIDIDARKQAETALQESDARLAQLADAAPVLIWETGQEGATFVNGRYLAYFGVGYEEIAGFRWARFVHPDDLDGYIAAYQRAFAERCPYDYECRLLRADGTYRWHRTSGRPAGSGRFIGSSTDIHDLIVAEQTLRESEERQRVLIEGIPQLVWRSDSGGEWTWASPQWSDYTGQTAEDSHGFGWLDALHPDDRDGAMAGWQSADGFTPIDMETRLFDVREGRHRWFQTRALPVRGEDGRIVEWLGTSTDIDDLRQLQERQQVLVAELQHRTRNLIGVVRAMSERTADGTSELPGFLTLFHARLGALARINSLLSKLDSGERVTFDTLLRTELQARGFPDDGTSDQVVLEGPQGVRLRSATVQTFALAIHELTTNAVKYGALSGGRGRLNVTWDVHSHGTRGDHLFVEWREAGVKDMPREGASAQGSGYGRILIEQALPYQLDAVTTYELGPDGVHCTIDLPLR